MNFVKFLGKFFCREIPSNHVSHNVFFFPFCRSLRFVAKNQFICWSNGKFGEGIHKPVQCCVVMEIRWKLHCQVVVTHVPTQALEVEEKKELKDCESGVNSPFV